MGNYRRRTTTALMLSCASAVALAIGCGGEPDSVTPREPFWEETWDEPLDRAASTQQGLEAKGIGGATGEGEGGEGGQGEAGAGGAPDHGSGGGEGGSGFGSGGGFAMGGQPGSAGSFGFGGSLPAGGGFGEAGGFGTGGSGTGGFGTGGFGTGGFGTGGFGTGGFGTGGFGTGGFGEGGFGTGGFAGGPGQPGPEPSAFWHMDDCSNVTQTLLDDSGNGIHAQRTVPTPCVDGIAGRAVEIRSSKHRVQALNGPHFAFDDGLTVGAWVNPATISGRRPIVLKRRNDRTAFSLAIQNGDVLISVVLKGGKTKTARAAIEKKVWSHVAGVFDGEFLTLFVNGEQVNKVTARGTLRDVDAPLRIGSTTQTQHFSGRIDDVFVSRQAATPEAIAALTCISRESTLAVSPERSGPHQPGTAFDYRVSLTNNDVGGCLPKEYFMFPDFSPNGLTTEAIPQEIFGVASGESADFTLRVTSSEISEEGVFTIPFFINAFPSFEFLFGSVDYEVAPPAGCHVKTARELFIRDVSVVDDPRRTTFDGPSGDPRTGAWTFGRLMRDMAPAPEQAPEMVETMLSTWLEDQTVNSFTIPARPAMQDTVLAFWPRSPDGSLDLEQSPLRLLAIVNRFDLRDLDKGQAGEGRFVFGVLGGGPFGFPLEFTLIVEYQLTATSEADVLEWANAWHALSEHAFPSEEYNAALQELTERFTSRGAAPARPNGSAINQLRTNEIALTFQWELREFNLSESTGFFEPVTVKLTPDQSFNFSPRVADFINENEASILVERHVVPDSFQGDPFLGGAIFNNIDFWDGPGIDSNEARHKFSLNTCNGCHGAESQTFFLHVNPRFPGEQAFLSSFLTGGQVFDPVTGELRNLNDLARRNRDLKGIVCLPEPPLLTEAARISSGGPAATATGLPRSNLRKGIGRVH